MKILFDGAVVDFTRGAMKVQYGFGRCGGARMIVVVVVWMVVSFLLVLVDGVVEAFEGFDGGDGVGAVIRARRGTSTLGAATVATGNGIYSFEVDGIGLYLGGVVSIGR